MTKLSAENTAYLKTLPESGMGYHLVSAIEKATNKIVSCIVYNCTDTKGNFSNSLAEIHLINQSIKTV